MIDVHLDRHRLPRLQGARGAAQIEPGRHRGGRPADRCVAVGGRGEGDQGGVAAVGGRHGEFAGGAVAESRDADDLHGDVRSVALGEAGAGAGAGVPRVLVAADRPGVEAVGVVRLAGAGRAALGPLPRRGAPVGRPQGEHGCGDDGGDDGRGDGTRAEPLPAGGPVLGVHREAAPVVARCGGPRARGRWVMAMRSSARGADRTGSSAGVTPAPGQRPGTARSAARRQRGQSSTCRTSSRRRVALSTSWCSPVRRATPGQPPVSTTASAARVRSTSQAAEASSSRAAARSLPRTAATSCGARWWRTASSSASRCSGVVPAASGQASWVSSRRRRSLASSEAGGSSDVGAPVAPRAPRALVVLVGVMGFPPGCRRAPLRAAAWPP